MSKNIFSLDSVPKEFSRDILEGFSNLAPDPAHLVMSMQDIGNVECCKIRDDTIEPVRKILYFHGGGYHFGSPYTHRRLACKLSKECNAEVIIIDYRKAPEYKFPAPIVDCFSVYSALLDDGLDVNSTFFGGDSAGGGLALACLIKFKENKMPLPKASFFLSPWVDLECKGNSSRRNAHLDPWLNHKLIVEFSKSYLGNTPPSHYLASPLNANLEGLPPMLIQVGTHEILYDDALRLHRKALECKVESKLSTWKKMIHVFQAFDRFFKEADMAIQEIGQFIREKAGVRL